MLLIKKILVVLFLFGCFLVCFSQKPADSLNINQFYKLIATDSLQKNEAYEKQLLYFLQQANKTQKWNYSLRFTNSLADYYIYNKPLHKKADSILTAFYPLLINCNNTKDIGKFYSAKTESSIYNYKSTKTLQFLTSEAIPFFEKEKDSSSYDFAYAYLKAGEISTFLNQFSESVSYFKKAEKLFTYQNDSLFLLWTKNGLSALFSSNGLYDEAEKERSQIYDLAVKTNQEQVAAMARIRAAMDEEFLRKSERALYHIRKAIQYNYEHSDIKEVVRFLTLSFAVSTYAQSKKIDSSNYYLRKLNKLAVKHKNNDFLLGYYQTATAYNAFGNNNFLLAKDKLLKLYRKKSKERILEVEFLLAKTYENLGNTKKSLWHYKRYSDLKDSINQSNSKRRFAYAKTIYETEKKDLQIKNQQSEITLLDIQNKQKNRYFLFGVITLFGIFLSLYLYRSRKHALYKQKQQEIFTQNLLQSQETERSRISRELHDGVGQQLILLKRKTQNENNNTLSSLTTNILDSIRRITRALHPSILEKLGLTEALHSLINQIDEETDIFFTVEIDDISDLLSKENELNLYRFFQESLNNIVKHAEAKAVAVKIIKEKSCIFIKITDNGKGFDVKENLKKPNSIGLKTLFERISIMHGKLVINSQKNSTIITAKIPL